jgi:hypothetical protein
LYVEADGCSEHGYGPLVPIGYKDEWVNNYYEREKVQLRMKPGLPVCRQAI